MSRTWTKNRCALVPVVASTAWHVLALVIAGVAVAVMIGCPFHCAAPGLAQASLPAAQQAPCPQATSGLACYTATVPAVISVIPVYLSTPYATALLASPTGFALPPFIPPRLAVGAHQLTRIAHPLGA